MKLVQASEPVTSAECSAWSKEARDLLAAGKPQQAAALASKLAAAVPSSFQFWLLLADCEAASGNRPAEIEALEGALAAQPHRGRARIRLARRLAATGELARAAAHLQRLVDDGAAGPELLLQLASLYRELRRPEAEAEAWTRFVAIDPSDAKGRDRLAELHMMAGRSREALGHLARALEARPTKAKLWALQASLCEDLGELDEAELAWSKLLELNPNDLSAERRLAQVRMLRRPQAPAVRSGRTPAARLSLLGNCQAHVLAACLRQLNPDLQVTSVSWADLVSKESLARAAGALSQADAVVVQPVAAPRLEPLNPRALAARGLRILRYPPVLFTGFHPDAVHAPRRAGLRSIIGAWHSALILAAFELGLPPHRTAELFNAYVYGVLGYFDEYASSARFLTEKARQTGWDISTEIETWRREGCFVHTPNHPRIDIMMSLARRVCAGLELDFDAEATPPPDPFDLAWPLYPEIGKRLGLRGEMLFTTTLDGGRSFDLDEAIAWFYDAYCRAPAGSLRHRRADEIVALLKSEGV